MFETDHVNREYRDRLFKFIFGNPERKSWTLSLYNAVNGSHYENPDEIEFNTIENVVYMSMRNDVSFLIGDAINLYEQQSTYNPNMPLRFLIYLGMLYERLVKDSYEINIYGRKRCDLPTPKCVCFYNGLQDKNDKQVLKLTDSFQSGLASDVEVCVTMLNVNYGRNQDLLNACQPLSEYSFFVDSIRKNNAQYGSLEQAVDHSIDALPEDSLIKSFLMSNRAEVKRMCLTEYDEEKVLNAIRREEREEGQRELYVRLIRNNLLTIEDAAALENMRVSDFKARVGLD